MRVEHWTIKITWDNGKEEYVSDVPNWVAKNVDEFLSDLEACANSEASYNEHVADSNINFKKDGLEKIRYKSTRLFKRLWSPRIIIIRRLGIKIS